MDDSFLDYINDVMAKDGKDQKARAQFSQHITTRGNYVSSTPESQASGSSFLSKASQPSQPSDKKAVSKPVQETVEKSRTPKAVQKSERRSVEVKHRTPKVKSSTPKVQEAISKFKILSNRVNLKEQPRPEKSPKESSSVSSDASSKENSHPIENRGRRDSARSSDGAPKKPILSDAADVTAFISAIKDLISTYVKTENAKVMRCLAEMHVDLKANLVQQLFLQTDDLMEELQPCKDKNRLRALVSENERLREDVMILQMRNDELRKRVQDAMLIKEENVQLKMKLKELGM